MKLLYVLPDLGLGGVQKVASEIGREQTTQGHDVHFLLLQDKQTIDIDFPANVSNLRKRQLFIRNPLWAVYYVFYKIILRNLLPHSEAFWAEPLFRRLANSKVCELEAECRFDAIYLRGIRVINHMHSLEHSNVVFSLHLPLRWLDVPRNIATKHWIAWLHRRIFMDRNIFFVSTEISDGFLRQCEKAGTKLRQHQVINNPCIIERIRTLGSAQLEYQHPFFLNVSRLTRQKRIDILIEAFAMLDTGHHLVIVGDGSLKPQLKRLSGRLGISDRVLFYGKDTNPYRWMTKATAFVLSSDTEGFPNVLLEALACGAPLISTRCEGASDILSGRLARGLVDRRDIPALAKKMKEYVSNPEKPSAADAERFDIKRCSEKYIKAALIGYTAPEN